MLFRLLLITVMSCLVPASSYAATGFTGPPAKLSTDLVDVGDTFVAYSPILDQHRVAWLQGTNRIKTRTVNGSGTLNNDQATVKVTGAGGPSQLHVPYISAGQDDWLISWQESFQHLRVQLHDQNGLVGAPVLVDTAPNTNNMMPSRTVYNPHRDEWVIVWTLANTVKIQRLSSSGTLVGPNQTLATTTATGGKIPSISYHPVSKQYLVTWYTSNPTEVAGIRVTAAPVDGALPLSSVSSFSEGDSLLGDAYRQTGGKGTIYDSEDNDYRLIWTGYPQNVTGQPANVFGYTVGSDGVADISANKKHIDDHIFTFGLGPVNMAYSPQSDQSVVAYTKKNQLNSNKVFEVYLRRSSDSGVIGSADDLVSLANPTDNPGAYTGVGGYNNLGIALDSRRNQMYLAWGRPGGGALVGAMGRGYSLGFGAWYPEAVVEAGKDVSLIPQVSGDTAVNYTLDSGSTLPAGLNLNSATGVISGRLANHVSSASDVNITIDVTSSANETVEVNVQLYIAPNQYYLSRQGSQAGANSDVGDPVNVVSGNAYYQREDFVLPGRGLPTQMLRTYNSLQPKEGSLGWGWSHIYHARLTSRKARDSQGVWNQQQVFTDHQGSEIPFTKQSNGSFTTLKGVYDSLATNGSDFILTRRNGAEWKFNSNGQLIEIRDRNNNALSLTYTADKLTSIADATGKNASFTYTGDRITSITAPDNRSFTYVYNGSGELTSYTDSVGSEWQYQYNADHRLTKVTTPGDLIHPEGEQTFGYYSDGRAAWSEGYNGHGRVELAYDDTAGTTEVTDARNFTSTYHFNERGDITRIDDPDGTNLQYSFDTNANRISATDQRGKTTNYQYDARGNLTEIKQPKPTDSDAEVARPTTSMVYGDYDELDARTDAENETTNYTYDPDGNMLTETDERGEVTSYTYNSFGQPETITDANSRISKFTYNPAGYVATSGIYADALDVNGKITSYSYNAWGDRSTVTNPLGKTITTAYDNASRPTTTTLPEVVTGEVDQIKYEYDPMGNLVAQEDALGHRRIYEYDRNYQLVHSEDESGRHSYYEYDSMGNLTRATDPAGISTQYEYSKQGRLNKTVQADGSALGRVAQATLRPDGLLATVTNPRGKATSYTYDNLGRLKEVLDAASQDTDYSYDKRGLLTSVTNARDNTTTFAYDARGARITKANQLGNTWEWRYDDVGLLEESEDALDRVTAYTYNEEDQLTQTSFPLSSEPAIEQSYDDAGQLLTATRGDKETAYQYDARARVTSETQSIGAADRSTSFGYDRADRLTSSKLPGNTVANAYSYDQAGRVTTLTDARSNQTLYSYDSGGRLAEIDYPGSAQSQAFTYTPAGETDTITHSLGLAGSRSLDHGYDKNGNLTGFTDSKGSDTTTASLAYDDLDRLSSESYVKGANTKSRAYSYGPVGNRTQLIANTGSGAVTSNYTYNNAERMTAAGDATYSYNANGEMTAETKNSVTTAYAYSRLGEALGEGASSFEYDGLSRRVAETHNSITTQQVFEGDQASQQYAGSTLTKELLRDPSGTLAAEYTPALSTNQTSYHYQDLLGSSVEVTSGGLAPEQSTSYNAFGDTREQAGLTPSQFTYLGNQTNPAGKTHNFHARSYDAANGRFLSQDPVEGIQTNPQSQNPYGYGFGNPYSNPDPTGLYPGEDIVNGAKGLAMDAGHRTSNLAKNAGLDVYYLARGAMKGDINWGAQQSSGAVTCLINAYCAATNPFQDTDQNIPTIIFNLEDYSDTGANILAAQREGKPSTLHYHGQGRKISRQKRREACKNFKGPRTCDEYPFASTEEGGQGARTADASKEEQDKQGGKLSSFYQHKLKHSNKFRVVVLR